MPTVPPTDDAIRRAAEILRGGGLVAFPTETVYGLGANALDANACARIFAVKRRPFFDPLIVHVPDGDGALSLCTAFGPAARKLADALWPGPLTLVLSRSERVPDIVTSGLDTVAVRVPDHPVALAILREARLPVAAPSANPFGYISPTLAEHVVRQLGGEIDLVIDGGACALGVESTIVDVSGERPVLLRSGATEIERIEALVGPLARPERTDAPRSSGQLAGHYSPRTPLRVLAGKAGAVPAGERVGLLAFEAPRAAVGSSYAIVEVLSERGDLREAAARLFACMHRLDDAGVTEIVAEPPPAEGLGVAILDRLRRAER